ncbi:MAG: hypothetical protein A2487_14230 [Candidatus Raymondbacteria bacterium RifOxyC12_full_50_8]|nr:MAG: hypothetical protein A2487_14230 [Candidatus Raymondbacteria bacterium RifOxyC12_full_50_8]
MNKSTNLLLCLLLIIFASIAQGGEKILLQGKYLNLVGGFNVPNVMKDKKALIWTAGQIDKLPGTNRWAINHPAGYVLELIEPDSIGAVGEPWPTMTEGRSRGAFDGVDKINPSGVFWLSENELLTSARKSYRGPFERTWMAKINLETDEETRYVIISDSAQVTGDFHMMQGLGSGFMRVADTAWANTNANGNNFLLGRGGYDVLGSPQGPALGVWNIGDSNATYLLDFPMDYPARRDPYYTYGDEEAKPLPIWWEPDSVGGCWDRGYWQAGDIGGLAYINHPQVKGIIATHNLARGILDYDAQGDGGSGRVFLVEDPAVFYSTASSGGNRGDHESRTQNAVYPKGVYGRVGRVYDPDHLAEVADGTRKPWECASVDFEWPRTGIDWVEEGGGRATLLGAVHWDDERQLLWLVIAMPEVKLVAYEIVVDDNRPEQPVLLPEGWEPEQNKIESGKRLEIESDEEIVVSPNPFNPVAVIKIDVARTHIDNNATVAIYNANGVCVHTFVRALYNDDSDKKKYNAHPISNTYTWNAASQPSGIYIVKATVGNRVLSKRITLIK